MRGGPRLEKLAHHVRDGALHGEATEGADREGQGASQGGSL